MPAHEIGPIGTGPCVQSPVESVIMDESPQFVNDSEDNSCDERGVDLGSAQVSEDIPMSKLRKNHTSLHQDMV